MPDSLSATPDRCLSVRQVAAHWRCSPRKVRALIRRGLLQAFDLGMGGRKQLRIAPEAIRACEMLLSPPAPAPKRRRQPDGISETVRALLDGVESEVSR
ncbi:hypothetical protein AYO44_03760 [Planctomycetaceae bacterium SCGC AG-212-F19]|nr:hypothetical protein AYO44_03760 [Planctomycetaceae bacterium SCGC AG-212-F19]